MKKIFAVLTMFLLTLGLVSCQKTDLKIGVVASPMSDVVEIAAKDLKKKGYKVKIVNFSDYVQVNKALNDGEIDVNFAQHELFMNEFNKTNKGSLVKIKGIYNTNLIAYSNKYKEVSEITKDSVIAIADEPINLARSLNMLKEMGLVEFDDSLGFNVELKDITKKIDFEIKLFGLTTLPKIYEDVDVAIMYPAFGQQIKLDPKEDSIAIESKLASEYDISIVARKDNKDSDIIKKFVESMTTNEVSKYLKDTYGDLYQIVF